jgi:hypothetical protein
VLGGARCGDADAEAGEVLDRAHGVDVLGGDEQGHGWRRGEPEDEPWRLARLAGPEAQEGLEGRRRQVRLALGKRLGGSGLGPRRPHGDGEAFPREVAFGLGHADREILG